MSSLSARARADLKEAWVGGGRLWRELGVQRGALRRRHPPTATCGRSSGPQRSEGSRKEPGARSRSPGTKKSGASSVSGSLHGSAGALPLYLLPHRERCAPLASMRLLTAALLLLLLALCAAGVDGECPEGLVSHSGEPICQMLDVVRSRVLSWARRAWKGERPRQQLSGPWALFCRVQMQVLPEGAQNPL